ncbi:MAG TPA: cation-translocating P-type ATPase, partial [Thermomicrobiales bacterium]|nr:cation-translocating P-type ATPase [Thermomicrobiales bacterium]
MSDTTAIRPMVFDVTGMDCGDCARSVERAVSQLPTVNSATVSLGSGTLTVSHGESVIDDLARTIERTVDRAGYTAMLRIEGQVNRMPREPWWKSRKVVPTAIAVVLWIVAFGIQHLTSQWNAAVAIYLAAIVIGGYPIARAALVSLKAHRVDMNVLMTISVIGASLIGEWSEGALVVVLFTVGTTMQALTLERTRSALRSLFDLAPDEATVVRDGVEMDVRAHTLVPGDLVRVRPGERVPADAEIVAGMSALNESAITGESLPVEKGEGQAVFAGSLNGTGTLTLRVTALPSESTLARIIHLVEEAQSSKAPSQQMIDRFASIYTPAVVVLAALIAVGGWLVLNDGETWFYRALVLLVIACPCALVISTPVSIVSAIGAATRQGMLVKGGAALEEAGRTRLVAFDKTGTLTLGRPAVTRVIVPDSSPVQRSETDVLALAAAVERDSEHPLGRAVIAKALHDRVPELIASDFASYPGQGAAATIDGRDIALGNTRL